MQTTLAELVALARRELAIPAAPDWGSMPAREWDATVWVADNRAIVSALGWTPRHTLEQGLRATVAWLRDNPGWHETYACAVLADPGR